MLRLGLLFALAMALFRQWQTPGGRGRLGHAEIERYLDIIARAAPMSDNEKAEAVARLRAWGRSDDGLPVYMLNLMRYYPALRGIEGGPPATMSPQEANRDYERRVLPLLYMKGGSALFAGNAQGRNVLPYAGDANSDDWDRMLVIRYPNRRAFFELLTDPRYLPAMPYKLASLEIVLTPFTPEKVLPDPTQSIAALLAALFLAIGWWAAAGRRR